MFEHNKKAHSATISIYTLCLPQCVPGAAGRNCVTQTSLTKHHSCEHISSTFEHTRTVSSVWLNCKRHCKSALYIAPACREYIQSIASIFLQNISYPVVIRDRWTLLQLVDRPSICQDLDCAQKKMPFGLRNIYTTKTSRTYSRKWVISRRLHFDHDTCTVSASKLGVITWTIAPVRLSQPVFSVSWYMPKLYV